MLKKISEIKKPLTGELNDSFKKAKVIRGTVAFWTIKTDFLDSSFLRLLRQEDSFYCVDYHFPTSIDTLNQFVCDHSSNIYLFNHRCSNNKDIHLMHSKMILLDFSDNEAELWVGSHNMTKTALSGRNVENSVVLSLKKDSPTYLKALEQLTSIRDLCIKFESKDLTFYKTLQDVHNFQKFVKNQADFENTEVVEIRKMFLLGKGIENLNAKTDTLLLLGNDEFSIKNLVFKTRIIIHTLDINSNVENIFEAEIVNFGKIDKNETKSYEITFSERFFALRSDKMIPFVFSNQSQIIGEMQLKECKYFINLKLYNRKDLLSSINNITDEDIWEISKLNEGGNTDYCDKILKSKKSEDLEKAIQSSNLNEMLNNKLAEKIENTIYNNYNNLRFTDKKTVIPFESYKQGVIRVEKYLKSKFNIAQAEELEGANDSNVVNELDNFTKEIFEQKELTKLSIAVYKK